MWRANSLEKTLMLGKIEGKRRRGQQWVRWLDGITHSMDMSLSKIQEIVKDREACSAPAPRVAKSWTWLSDWITATIQYPCSFNKRILPLPQMAFLLIWSPFLLWFFFESFQCLNKVFNTVFKNRLILPQTSVGWWLRGPRFSNGVGFALDTTSCQFCSQVFCVNVRLLGEALVEFWQSLFTLLNI